MSLSAMLEATREFPQHLLDGLEAAQGAPLPEGSYRNAVAVGMGGSSIGGALTAGLLEGEADVPIHVLRGPDPPGFVGEDTLVVATSYSGTTRETLSAVRESLGRGATLAAVSTGGELGPLAEDSGGPLVRVPSGYQPRAAVGWLFSANYTLFARSLGVGDPDAISDAAKRLEPELDELAAEGGPADELAGRLGEGPVGVVGHDVLGVVARRWAGELSENGKRLAFHAELPEMAHNQIVGWDGEPGDATLLLVRRDADDETPLEATRLDYLAESADRAGARVVETRLGASGLAGICRSILVGDLVSLHLARQKGIDPAPVEVIDGLKDRLDRADRSAPSSTGTDGTP